MTTVASQYAKKDEFYGQETFFRELGYYILKLEQYKQSLKPFNNAIKYTPSDIRALIGRSKARAKASQYDGALEDINKALKIDPKNLSVLAEKALDTFLSCEFEDGLVQNSRLLPVRQKPEHFAVGVMHCSNAIETSIGEYAGRPLRDHFQIIRKLGWAKNQKVLQGNVEPKKINKPLRRLYLEDHSNNVPSLVRSGKKSKKTKKATGIKDSLHSQKLEKNVVPILPEEFPFNPLQNYTTNIKNFMAEKYLGFMYLDKNFLKKIQNEPGTYCPNQKGSEKIISLAKVGYKMVSYKQELLRNRRPFYHIKYIEGTSTATLKLRQAQDLYIQQKTTKKEADFLLMKLQQFCKEKKFKETLNYADKLKAFCDAKPKRLLPDRDIYLQKTFEFIRQSYYQLYRLNSSQYPWDQVKRIYCAFGLPISRKPSTDSVIDDVKPVFIDYKKQIEVVEKRLKEQAQTDEEICWCYYELCKNSIELKRFELARIYAKQCIQQAKQKNNLEWMFVTNMLLVKINVQQRNRNDARTELNYANDIAEQLANNNLKLYLDKCLEIIENIDSEGALADEMLVEREQKILGIMNNSKLKTEFTNLFRLMSALPASRRMPVVPGVRVPEDPDQFKTGSKGKASIKPRNTEKM